MADRYLDVEFQNDEGNVVYPHSRAETTWTQEGPSVEEILKKKAEIVISSVAIPTDQRKEGAIYMFVEGETATPEAAVAKASPSVGYKMIR